MIPEYRNDRSLGVVAECLMDFVADCEFGSHCKSSTPEALPPVRHMCGFSAIHKLSRDGKGWLVFSLKFGDEPEPAVSPGGRIAQQCGLREIEIWRLPCPATFFDVKDGHRLFDASGFVCDDDADAIIRATVLAVSVSLDKPEDDPERRIAIINDEGREIATVPVYSKPSYERPAT